MQNHLLPFSLNATNFVLALIVLPTPQMTPNAIKAEVPPTLPGGAFFGAISLDVPRWDTLK